MARLATKTEFARLANVTQAAVTKFVVRFPAAMVGPRVDLDHPDARAYLERRDRTSTRDTERQLAPSTPPTAPRPAPGPARPLASTAPSFSDASGGATAEDIAEFGHWSLDKLTKRFGTAIAFVDWLDARKRISHIEELDLKNRERTGRLIPRELVRVHVFGAFEELFKRLLQDTAVTLARRAVAAVKSGASAEEVEQMMRDTMRDQLRSAKEKVIRVLGAAPDSDSEAA